MKLISALSAVVAICISSAAIAEPSLKQLTDEFIKVLPDDLTVRPNVDPKELSRLVGLNPGRETNISPILAAYEQCLRPAVDDGMKRFMRSTAEQLGVAKVTKLIEFYGGADYPTYVRLLAKIDAGQTLTAAESTDVARMLRDYPLNELERALQSVPATMLKDEKFIGELTKCSVTKRDALIAAGLKFRP